jgi:hypothetical protein
MRNSFPSRDQLCAMSLDRLRLVEIKEKDEEDLVQEIINSKTVATPSVQKVYRGDVPEIKTPEQEKVWQEKINEREAKIKEQEVVVLPEAPVAPEAPEEAIEEIDLNTPNEDRFCQFCNSKGKRHKKECTRPQ